MIYDCFTFFNELDLLEIRLNVLKDAVDRFVLVEVGETHTGKPKPMYFKENEARFADFKDKIVYLGFDRFPEICQTSWMRENWQRNAISQGLTKCRDDDVILISDMDEIPRPELICQYAGHAGIVAFAQRYYSFYLNYLDVSRPEWYGTKMVSYADFKHCFDGVVTYENEFMPASINQGTTATKIRCRRLPSSHGGTFKAPDGGWHFTCLGGARAVLGKMRSVAPHLGFDPDDATLTEKDIAALIAKGHGPAQKMRCFGVPLDRTFPQYIIDNRDYYAHLVFKVTPEYLRSHRVDRWVQTLRGRMIQLAERCCPPALHNALHLVKVWLKNTGNKR